MEPAVIPPHALIFRFYVQIEDAQPPIWRILDISGTATFWDLHCALTDLFGWNDSHLHKFDLELADGQDPMLFASRQHKPRHISIGMPEFDYYGKSGEDQGERLYRRRITALTHGHLLIVDDLAGEETDDPLPSWEIAIADLLLLLSPSFVLVPGGFRYLYDFGDSWYCTIKLMDMIAHDSNEIYPHCVAGKRAGPPNDFGGTHIFNNYIAGTLDADKAREKRTWLRDMYPGWRRDRFQAEAVHFSDPDWRLAQAWYGTGRTRVPTPKSVDELLKEYDLPS